MECPKHIVSEIQDTPFFFQNINEKPTKDLVDFVGVVSFVGAGDT